MIKLLKFLKKKEWLFFVMSLAFIVSQVWLDLKLPDYMSEITKLVESEGSAMHEIWLAGGKMMLCSLGSLASSVLVCFFASKIAAGFSKRLRGALFNKVESFSTEEINRFSTASLITRSTNDVMQVQMMIVMSMQVVIKAPLMAAWAITKIAGKAWQWSVATGVVVAVLIIMLAIIMTKTFPRFRKIQWLQDGLNHAARENLTGLRVVRAYNAEKYQEAKFEKANTELLENQLYANRALVILNPFMNLSMNGLSMAIYWIGAILINGVAANGMAAIAQRVDIFADMVVFMAYAMQVIMSFLMIVIVFMIAPRALVAADRINEVLQTEPAIADGKAEDKGKSGDVSAIGRNDDNVMVDFGGDTTVIFGNDGDIITFDGIGGEKSRRGEVEFKHVSFAYPGGSENVLTDINFKANKGETVAFIGSTGSGKTSLINLIPRFYDTTEGEVLVDGVNVRDYKLDELYSKLGYVSQKAVMFSGTVESNLLFGAGADREKLQTAIEVSQSAEFISQLDKGLEAHVAQGGSNFSGGQKQRMSIARAICRDAEILIFDDTFSALDFSTDRELRNALKKETAGVTMLIVAQRIGTIMGADKIIVLDEGRQVGMGTHCELLKSCEVYRQIALSQLSEEELAI